MDLDTRSQALRILGQLTDSVPAAVVRVIACGVLALAVVLMPRVVGSAVLEGLSVAGQIELGILIFAAGLWITEAMPAFAVGLLVIGMQIGLLGRPGGALFAPGNVQGWTIFVAPWASPIMWLFLGGFVLAHGCTKTGLDRWMAGIILRRLDGGTPRLLAGVMGITFVLSMFMSNTATAAMMVAIVAGLTRGMAIGDARAKALLIGVPVAANLGGMGTLIGSPPNAIAASAIGGERGSDFLGWMLVGLPPALLLAGVAFTFLYWRYLRGLPETGLELSADAGLTTAHVQQLTVMAVFTVTVLLWMTEALHGIPTPVVSFLPIVVLAVTGVVGSLDIRELPWDVLILLAGGLSLGVGVEATGLAQWMAGQVPAGLGPIALSAVLVVLAVTLSNLMSNTAAASLLVPIGAGLSAGAATAGPLVIPIALACSAAMALPISTPPNAVAYASGRLASRDFLGIGLLMAVVGAVMFVLWSQWVLESTSVPTGGD